MPQQSQLPLAQLGRPDRYQIPLVVGAVDLAIYSEKAPLHILIQLETGHELEIPLTQEALDKVLDILRKFRESNSRKK